MSTNINIIIHALMFSVLTGNSNKIKPYKRRNLYWAVFETNGVREGYHYEMKTKKLLWSGVYISYPLC